METKVNALLTVSQVAVIQSALSDRLTELRRNKVVCGDDMSELAFMDVLIDDVIDAMELFSGAGEIELIDFD